MTRISLPSSNRAKMPWWSALLVSKLLAIAHRSTVSGCAIQLKNRLFRVPSQANFPYYE